MSGRPRFRALRGRADVGAGTRPRRRHGDYVGRCAPWAIGVFAQNTTVCAQSGARPVFLSRAIPTRHR
jgi:hypothetical protein